MATLAEMLRQTGYAKDGQLEAPAPTQPNLSTMAGDYFKQLPAKTAQNAIDMNYMVQNAMPYNPQTGKFETGPTFSEFANYVPNLMGATAWHGTPHKILGKFDISKIGTGEGAQNYGHGMYFAQAKPVAETYKRAGSEMNVSFAKPLEELGINPKVATNSMDFDQNPVNQGLGRIVKGLRTTALDYPDVPINKSLVKEHFDEYIRLLEDKYPKDAAQKKALQDLVAKEGYPDINFGGNLYKVDIPDEHIPKTLNWYESFENQPKDVQEALRNLGPEITFGSGKESVADWLKTTGNLPPHLTKQSGHGIYSELSKQLGGDKQASEYLNNLGIKGIQYENFQIKKGQGGGTNNYVMFEPSDVKILEENGIPTRKELIQQQIDKIE
jgi:hypothetical protein